MDTSPSIQSFPVQSCLNPLTASSVMPPGVAWSFSFASRNSLVSSCRERRCSSKDLGAIMSAFPAVPALVSFPFPFPPSRPSYVPGLFPASPPAPRAKARAPSYQPVHLLSAHLLSAHLSPVRRCGRRNKTGKAQPSAVQRIQDAGRPGAAALTALIPIMRFQPKT